MCAIPAAAASASDIEQARLKNPAFAIEMTKINQLLSKGIESKEDVARLAEILVQIGRVSKAELLLVANSASGDLLHAMHRKLFSGTEKFYNKAVQKFADQKAVVLDFVRSPRLYCDIFKFTDPAAVEGGTSNIPAQRCVQFTYDPMNGITADIFNNPEFDQTDSSVILHYNGTHWEA